jgi:S-adenosylmethionine synthetase
MADDFIFTSGSLTVGHPDKLCDRISDAVVDRFLREDPLAQVNAECAVATGILFLALRYASPAAIEAAGVAREAIRAAGYTRGGFKAGSCSIMTSLGEMDDGRPCRDERDLDPAEYDAMPADHQVTLFGFACDQSPSYLPLPIHLAHAVARRMDALRGDGTLPGLMPDGQSQVSVAYRERRPAQVPAVAVVTGSWPEGYGEVASLQRDVEELVVRPVLEQEAPGLAGTTKVLVNPHGKLLQGGPEMHAGLTGRKTAIDTYGEYARHSGAALSGKDPGRIDRAGAYAARQAALCVVAAGLARECEVQLSYGIGLAQPLGLDVETFGTATLPDEEIKRRLRAAFDFRPAAILARLGLRHLPGERRAPFYEALATYGHMGRADLAPPWEDTAPAELLKS